MNPVPFSKYHGLGNDLVLLDAIRTPALLDLDWPGLAPSWCDRHAGVGADGLLVVAATPDADARVAVINADGSDGGVCGNGLRCVARHLVEHHGADPTRVRLHTPRGPTDVRCSTSGPFLATVDMGPPALDADAIPVLAETPRVIDAEPVGAIAPGARMTCVSMGNPHVVFFVDDADAVDLARVGPMVEHHPRFPRRVNVQVAQVLSSDRARLRTWERGAGLTRACGTGACATLVAGVLTHRLERRATVELPGGPLEVEWDPRSGRVLMTGPAVPVFTGVREG
ncbi:MAG: diaminopimelate epimerase [Phycisphaerae bacterium]|nr:diaminopimelate epimerase [Phycisphaerae bacterium]